MQLPFYSRWLLFFGQLLKNKTRSQKFQILGQVSKNRQQFSESNNVFRQNKRLDTLFFVYQTYALYMVNSIEWTREFHYIEIPFVQMLIVYLLFFLYYILIFIPNF